MKVKGWVKLFICLFIILGLSFLAIKGPVIYEKETVTNDETGEKTVQNGDMKVSFGANKLVGRGEFGETSQFILKPVSSEGNDVEATDEELENSKNIMMNRLKNINIKDYRLYIDSLNKKLVLEMDDSTDFENTTSAYVISQGNLNLSDSQGNIILNKEDISNIEGILQENSTDGTHEWYVTFHLTPEGQTKFATASETIANLEPYSINLGNGQTYDIPQNYISIRLNNNTLKSILVSQKMDTDTLSFNADTDSLIVSEMKSLLNLEQLPYDFEIETSGTESANYPISMAQITLFIVYAVATLVLLFSLFKYRLNGIVFMLALVTFAMLNIVLLSVFQKGIDVATTFGVLSAFLIFIGNLIGMFEKISIKMKSGKNLDSSIDTAYKEMTDSFSTMFISTLIIAVVLQIFSNSNFKSFGLAFGLGIIVSFVSLLITKIILKQLYIVGLRKDNLYISTKKSK